MELGYLKRHWVQVEGSKMEIHGIKGYQILLIIVGVACIISILATFALLGGTTNAITIIVTIAMIGIIIATTTTTEHAIRETADKSSSTLNSIKTELTNMNTAQGALFSRIHEYINRTEGALNAKPRITLRREKKEYLKYFIHHYYLWVTNTNGRNVTVKIEPKPDDSSGIYSLNEESQKDFYINDWGIINGKERIVTITCEGLNGTRYNGQMNFKDITEAPSDVPLNLL
ncbi:MAG: hypothetical protein KGH69_03280 [Candidatus Micrarchaeota archaeon]|nr:hypothetical protein [Candidatus Micrarchaeota archaeon]